MEGHGVRIQSASREDSRNSHWLTVQTPATESPPCLVIRHTGATTRATSPTGSRTMTNQYRIASIPADGIGPEVISAGLEVLDAVAARDGGFSLTIDHYDWGSELVSQAWRVHAGGRAGLAAHRRRDLFRRGRRSRTFRTTSRCGACGCRSARASTSTPTCGRHASCRASPRRCATSGRAISTG